MVYVWHVLAWNMIALRNIRVECSGCTYSICNCAILVITFQVTKWIPFRNLCFKRLTTPWVLSFNQLMQVRSNNHWSTSQVRLKILNYRTLTVYCSVLIHLHVGFCRGGIFFSFWELAGFRSQQKITINREHNKIVVCNSLTVLSCEAICLLDW
jgi:hypothetical protein